MNIVIYNQAKSLIESLEIDVIKSVSGVFSVTELKEMFSNMYYERLIIDITSIKDYKSNMVLQNLANSFDMSKVVLILENSDEGVKPNFISGLISLGIYNFTRNRDGLLYFLKNTNSYNDVAHLHHANFVSNDVKVEKTVKQKKIIGFVNVTEHAGASTLIYMLMKNIIRFEKVVGIELDKFDFKYFRHTEMVSSNLAELDQLINNKYADYNIVLIDLNNNQDCAICTDIVYLIEPSIIKMNKLTAKSKDFMTELKFKKVVLNKSNISPEAIHDFGEETGLVVLANIKSLNDREENQSDIINLAEKLSLIEGGFPVKKKIFN